MTSSLIEQSRAKFVRAGRMRRILMLAVVGLLVVGAFLLWGPIGLGNGPLSAGAGNTEGGVHAGRDPVGIVIPVHNSGNSPAVVDALDLIGGTSYPGPHVLRLEVLSSGACGGVWPVRQVTGGFVLAGCGGTNAGPLAGHAFGATQPVSFGFPVAAELAAPSPGGCWVLTKIIVHYHVGIRHYTATGPYQLALCADGAMVNAAMNAAEATS